MATIDHVVIIVKENHTFDNYFGRFPGAEGAALASAANPPPSDPDHKHQTWTTRASDERYKVQYGDAELPRYWQLARKFTLCDNYFSEVAGPSTPNHLMLICADAPLINNPAHHYRPLPGDAFKLPSLPAALEAKGLSWGNYGGYAFHYIDELAGHPGNHTRDLFSQHAAAGQLPTVSWVYGDGRPDLSEHPTQNVTDGEQWTLQQIRAVIDGGLWDKTMVFVTWDDWGGWFDHITPPVVEEWDPNHAQRDDDRNDAFAGQPFRYGSRVPCLCIGPYAKPGHISTQQNSHVSLLKFCEDTFGIEPLTKRDAAANGMSDCVDYAQQPLAAPAIPSEP